MQCENVPAISPSRRRVPASQLRAARLHRGLTQDQLARLLDVRVATISERENAGDGVAEGVVWEIWIAWAAVCGLSSDWTPPTSTKTKKPAR
jgi:DNA-binding XRE family transcriptional regulator